MYTIIIVLDDIKPPKLLTSLLACHFLLEVDKPLHYDSAIRFGTVEGAHLPLLGLSGNRHH
jgi:hypothetical protein